MQRNGTQGLGCPRCWQQMVLLAVLVFGSVGSILAETTVAPGSLDAAVAQVEEAHSGRVLSARAEERDGGLVYVIRLLTEDQQVRTVEVQASEEVRP